MNIWEDPNVNSINRKKIYSKQSSKNSYPHKYDQGARPKYKQDKAKIHKRKEKVHEIDREECSNYYDSSDSDTVFVGALYNEKKESDTWCEDITVGDISINFQLGTGARCNVLNRSDFKRMKTNSLLSKPDSRLKSFSGHNIECDGRITLPVTLKNQKHDVELYVANTKSQSVLGAATC
ncbi:unnamed protein product [Mytilus coruscus]|uniref:Uncharacterized protein n=1 Tax=Mytilus coruscus TaxID=42192 RepID=A0A6J8D2J8_MYTCO|nr:unnamed protein product [Mytilus coruscus]